MLKQIIFALIISITVLAMPTQAAQASLAVGGSGSGACDHYYHTAVAAVVGVINAGDLEIWGGSEACGVARSTNQVITWVGRMSGPVALAVPTLTWSTSGFSGCTAGTPTTVNDATVITTGSATSILITMTSAECRGVITFTMTIAAISMRINIPVGIVHENDAEYMFLCNFTGTTATATDPDASTCNAPFIGEANFICDAPGVSIITITTSTVCNDLVLSATLSGSLTLAGTINVVNSGGQTISISSWPTLVAALSGGLTITDDANGWSITSTNALSGTVNVVNSGGQTIAVSSWPSLVAALTGDLNVHQEEACGATIPCQIDGDIGFTGSFNFTNTGNTTIMPGFTETEEFQHAMWLFLFFIFLIILAEWKKDMIYYLIAIVVGISVMSVIDTIGVPKLGVVALIIYLIMRCYKVSKDARNTTNKEI